jgi:hypothetical protein
MFLESIGNMKIYVLSGEKHSPNLICSYFLRESNFDYFP